MFTLIRNWDLKQIHIFVLTILFAIVNIAVHWPGQLNNDSEYQLQQAISGVYRDWHPPIMAVIWNKLLFLGVKAPMLVMQIALHWIGIGLFASYLCREKLSKVAFIMLLSGFTPIALKYTGIISKDTLLTSFLLAGFGLATINDVRLKFVGILLGLIGMLSRANGIFAFPALLFFALERRWRLSKTLFISLAFSILLIPTTSWVNHYLLQADRDNTIRALQLYDLLGIAYFSKDTSVLPVTINEINICYTPLFWDTLGGERCENAFARTPTNINYDWLAGIATYPVSYAMHRLSHFNRETFFLVPPIQQCVDAPEYHSCPKTLFSDAITKNGFLWPIAWLVLGIVILTTNIAGIGQALCLSGLLYGFGYLIVGLAADFRYFYWTELAIQTSLILNFSSFGFVFWRKATFAILTVWILGYAWRIFFIFS